jgi:exopolysaccharide biosynthesis protein
MKKSVLVLFLALALISPLLPSSVSAAALADTLSGRILLDVEGKGEAWYVDPIGKERFFLGRPTDAFNLMRTMALGVSEKDFQRIAQEGTSAAGDKVFAKKMSGRILLRVEKNGESWYVNPVDLKKYYLGRPSDAFSVMRRLGLGITKANLATVPRANKDDAANSFSNYKYRQTVKTERGDFYVDIVEIALNKLRLKIVTDTAGVEKCSSNCPTKSLYDYVANHKAFAAVNGSYFDTGSRPGYYFAPVYNSLSKELVNGDQTKYPTTGPLMAFDENNKFYYFPAASDFKSVANFESLTGKKLSAAISNKPHLIEEGQVVLKSSDMDSNQRTVRTWRNAIGYTTAGVNVDGTVYLVFVRNATVEDLASVMKALKMDYAMNLDGGYSTALHYNNEYKLGPGRNIPNALLFVEK